MLVDPIVSYHGTALADAYKMFALPGRLEKLDVVCYVGGDALVQFFTRDNRNWTPSSPEGIAFTQGQAVSMAGLAEQYGDLGGVISVRAKNRVAGVNALVDFDFHLLDAG